MATEIPYCDETWAVTAGCTKCETGCLNDWAERVAKRLKGKGVQGYDKVVDKNGWTGHIELLPWNLDKPLRWRKPRRIFVNSMSDLFHQDVPDFYKQRIFLTMAGIDHHTYLIFTKRIKEAYLFWTSKWTQGLQHEFGLKNIQLILSLSTQKEADEKIPILLQIPATVRGLSIEPLLSEIDLHISDSRKDIIWRRTHGGCYERQFLQWCVVGCESLAGGKAGRFQDGFIDAARSIVQQCQADDVPVYVKQIPINGKVVRDIKQFPKDLQIQQYPKGKVMPNDEQ